MRTLLTALALLAASSTASAVDVPSPRWTFGAMVLDRGLPYRGYDESLLVLPLVRFEGERVHLRGLRGSVVLNEQGPFEFSAFLQVRPDGYKADRSDYLAGMDDRDSTLDAGLSASYTNPKVGQFELSLGSDVLGRSSGQEAQLEYTIAFNAGGWLVVPKLALRWKSSDLVDYYYGVRSDEALVGRAAYSPGSAVVPELSVLALRPIGKRWTLFAGAGYSRLPTVITDSPIVDSNRRVTTYLALGYSPE
jgi:MipA family protein